MFGSLKDQIENKNMWVTKLKMVGYVNDQIENKIIWETKLRTKIYEELNLKKIVYVKDQNSILVKKKLGSWYYAQIAC